MTDYIIVNHSVLPEWVAVAFVAVMTFNIQLWMMIEHTGGNDER